MMSVGEVLWEKAADPIVLPGVIPVGLECHKGHCRRQRFGRGGLCNNTLQTFSLAVSFLVELARWAPGRNDPQEVLNENNPFTSNSRKSKTATAPKRALRA